MSKKVKTNAMRLLEENNIEFEHLTYESKDGKIDGVSVAKKMGVDPQNVYKTLVTQSPEKDYFVFVIPVEQNLSLKKAAKLTNQKNIQLIPVNDINKITGYIRGGCSPLAMKKTFRTFIDISARDLSYIVISAGKIGHQLKVSPMDLAKLIEIEFEDVVERKSS